MEYVELVEALKKNPQDILATLTPEKVDAWHMATGVAGEALELLENYPADDYDFEDLDNENLVEELGDLYFYLTGICLATGVKLESSKPNSVNLKEDMLQLALWSGKLLDAVKKWVVYNKEDMKPVIESYAGKLAGTIEATAKGLGFSMQFITRYNKAKLTERYGEKYSDAAAQARADKAGE